jgi:hypothetical protein
MALHPVSPATPEVLILLLRMISTALLFQTLATRPFLATVGTVVGGGYYVNGMQSDRGSDAHYDAWGKLENEGWCWIGLEPYFKKSNYCGPPSEESTEKFGITYEKYAYGNGHLKVSIPDYQFPDMKTIFHAWDEDQYLKDRSDPYLVGKAHGFVFIALQHFDSAFKETVSKIRSQVVVNFLPARYAEDKKLLASYKKQREILAHQFSEADPAVGELVIQPYGFFGIANNKPLSRGTITLDNTHSEAYSIVQ